MELIKRYWTYFLAVILLVWGIILLGKAHAYENPHAIQDIDFFYCRVSANQYDNRIHREDYLAKYQFHKENGER